MNSSTTQPGTNRASAGRPRTAHRRDIDGLRGLAIALVVVFHVFVGRVSSGVDVFLLVGGIFFFAPQIRNALNPAGLTVVQSFLRILRRLYPALITVVLVMVAAVTFVYPPTRWVQTGTDATASLLYFQNFHLASAGQEYAAINRDVSLFQHIWSMSVQLQIYLGSLMVITLLALFLRSRPRVGATVFHGLLLLGTAASFAYAVWLHNQDQAWNYYSPLSRFWEIGLGGLFGMWLIARGIPRGLEWFRWPAGIVGVVLIVSTGMFFDGAAQFPGPLTLIPLFGAVLVIISGNPSASRSPREQVGVSRLLEGSFFQFLGRISYGLYLWHWPLLVLATFWFSTADGAEPGGVAGITASLGPQRGIVVGLLVILASVVLAWATWRFVEVPLRQGRKPYRSWVLFDRSYWQGAVRLRRGVHTPNRGKVLATVVIVAATAGVVAFGPYAEVRNEREAQSLAVSELDPADYPGPRAYLDNAPVPSGVEMQPPAIWDEKTMNPQSTLDGCVAQFPHEDVILTQDFNESDIPCAYGDVDSDRTMYLAGGSHSEHYLAALDAIGVNRGIKIVPVLKIGCVVGMDLPHLSGDAYPECAVWQREAAQWILDNPPTDGVFMTTTRPTTMMGDGPDHVPAGYVDIVRRLSEAGIHTWGVRDNPWTQQHEGALGNSLLCLADGYDPVDCGPSESQLAEVNPAYGAYKGLDITHIDLTPAYCRDGDCPASVGNVQVYRDGNHFTPTWMALMAPELSRQMYDPMAVEESRRAAEEAADAAPAVPAGDAPKDVFRLPKPGEDAEGGELPGSPDPAEPPAPVVPDQGWVDPGYVDPGYGWVDPGYVDPGYGYVDPGYVDPGYGYAPPY
ncbi:acyltransferase family protein [Corynebacterium kalidii]